VQLDIGKRKNRNNCTAAGYRDSKGNIARLKHGRGKKRLNQKITTMKLIWKVVLGVAGVAAATGIGYLIFSKTKKEVKNDKPSPSQQPPPRSVNPLPTKPRGQEASR